MTVRVYSGELPGAAGKDGHDLAVVVTQWQRVAAGGDTRDTLGTPFGTPCCRCKLL